MRLAYALVVGMVASMIPVQPVSATSDVFRVTGSSPHWEVSDFFSPSDFGDNATLQGYEFGPVLTYTGPATMMRWYRVESFFPTLEGSSGSPAVCALTIDLVGPKGFPVESGRSFTHGRCRIVPWNRSEAALEPVVLRGLYLITWEGDGNIYAEAIRPTIVGGTDEPGPHKVGE